MFTCRDSLQYHLRRQNVQATTALLSSLHVLCDETTTRSISLLLLSLAGSVRSCLFLLPRLTDCLLHSPAFSASYFTVVRSVIHRLGGKSLSLQLCLLRQCSRLLQQTHVFVDDVLPIVAHFARIHFPPTSADETPLQTAIQCELITLFTYLVELGAINHKSVVALSLQVVKTNETAMERGCELLCACSGVKGVIVFWEVHGIVFQQSDFPVV